VIDLDILFYEQEVIDSLPLTIPHPSLEQRAFVLVPLADLAPHHLHPISGDSMLDLLAKVDRQDIVWYSPNGCDEQNS
jgi:2-amino-4-hydroxy-6-hydroxymethyldihydropteridine diphosphokinase